MKNNFEERKQQRIDYAREQAAKNKKLSGNLAKRASEMAKAIPMGQPILIGHHSEKRDRNYRSRIHDTFGKSVAAESKASYYEQKADTIESNKAIFSDDPQAIEKLKAQLEHLQKLQVFMKAANKCVRKKDKDAFLKMEGATETLWDRLNTPDCFKLTGFAVYKLTNNNANISRIKKRIAHLESIGAKATTATRAEGIRLIENAEAGRVQITFEEKPNEEVRKLLKGWGFRWSPTQKAWQRHLNGNGIFAAKTLFKKLTNQPL